MVDICPVCNSENLMQISETIVCQYCGAMYHDDAWTFDED